jgi:ATP-binding cassette subfamily B protein
MPAPTTSFQSSREYPTGELVRRLLALAWHYRADFLLSMVLSLVLLLLGLLGLQLLGVVIDVIRHALDPSLQAPHYPFGWRPPASWTPVQIVTALALAIMAQAGLRAILTYHYNLSTARLTQAEIVPDLRDKLYARLQRLSFHFFDVHGSSSIFNRVTGDVQNTRLFVDGVLLQGLNMLLTLAAYAVFMWHIHPGLTLACLWVALPLWWVTDYYSRRLRPAYLRNRELSDDLVQLFTESVKGMQTIKGFAAERPQIRRFEEGNQRVSAQQRRIFMDLSVFTPLTQLLSQASLVILFAYGGWLFLKGEIPLGSGLVVFAGLLQQFNGQVANISNIANSVQQSLAAARRVFEVLDMPLGVESKPRAITPKRLTGRIAFESVTFGYVPEHPVLHEVSFETKPGQVVGLFGLTGSGKSTVLSLIPRFYDPPQGRVTADWTLSAGRWASCIRRAFSFPTPSAPTSPLAIRAPPKPASSRRRAWLARMSSSWPCRAVTPPFSENPAWTFRAANGSGWPWRAPCCWNPQSSFWMTRRLRWIPGPSMKSSPPCARP